MIPASGGVERIVSSFGYEPRWSPDGTLLLFKRSAVLPDLPTIYVVGLDGKPPRPVRADVLGQFKSLHAAWHPGSRRISVWGTSGARDTRFLTVPLDGGSPTTPEIAARVHQDLESVSAGRFAWATSRRYIYFEGRAGDTQNIWRITVDPVTEGWIDGPERLTTGAGQERAWRFRPTERGWSLRRHRAGQGCGNSPSTPPPAASPASRLPLLAAAREKSISTYGPMARDRVPDRPGWPQRIVGTIDGSRRGAAPAIEHGLAPCETAVVA